MPVASKSFEYVVGIDEAGRGPLAGPVAVGAVIVSPLFQESLVAEMKGKDSKKLSHQKRVFWFKKMHMWKKQGLIDFHVALVSHSIIDTQGISQAINLGIEKCLKKLRADIINYRIMLDGSLKAPKEFTEQKTIIKGDEKHYQIGLASIAAKVMRDKKMEEFSRSYPNYNFDIHKGYGTYDHRKLIKKFGPSKIHRKSFLKNLI